MENRKIHNVLVIGAGGREHALCWRLKHSLAVGQLFCSPGNGGIAEDATCVALKTHDDIIAFCKEKHIALVVIGPEQPLVEGLADRLRGESIPVFGPNQNAARLEGSKGFMKELCKKYNIPTAAYGFFDSAADAKHFLKDKTFPIVVKADGLAAGKGVVIAETMKEATGAIDDMFAGKISGGNRVVIEEFLSGEEVSFFALCDGENVVPFGHAQDHKRAFDGDKGPNTGGMGTYAPTPLMTDALAKTVMDTIIRPTARAMKQEGCPFSGVFFAGLMLTSQGPKLLEYNVRFGDPETQVLMMLHEGDLFALLLACAKGNISSPRRGEAGRGASFAQPEQASPPPNLPPTGGGKYAVCVVMAAKGYPGEYEKGSLIRGLDKAAKIPGVKIFHAGTQKQGNDIVANGGRVLGVTALGASISDAQANAYRAIALIDWPQGFYRRDIAWRAIKHIAG